jgi:hypothetical protein
MGKKFKLAFGFILVIGSMATCHAAELLSINTQFSHIYTNLFTITGTNGVSVTNTVNTPHAIYHTFQYIYTATGTNTTTVVTENTVDGVNYVPAITNVFSSSVSNIQNSYTGKWLGFRVRATFQNTNAPTLLLNNMNQ